MILLNAILAFGALAAAVPLAIHLLNRSRFRQVDWGAMHLLESVLQTNQRRFRIDQLLLLLVRCAIPIILALCLARPVLTGLRQLRGDSPMSLLIVLDNSYSMATRDENESRFDRALKEIENVVGSLARGSDVNILLTGGNPQPLFDQSVRDTDTLLTRLRGVRPGYDRSAVDTSLDEAAVLVSSMDHASREVLIVSDFQPGDWGQLEASRLQTFRSRLDLAEVPVEVTLIPIGSAAETNLSVEILSAPTRSQIIGDRVVVRAEIRNHGNAAVDQRRVQFVIDGNLISESTVTVAPKGSSQVVFRTSFDEAGSYLATVRLDSDDRLEIDNTADVAFHITDAIPVLLVDGAPGRRPLEGETDFLALALTPNTFGLGTGRDQFRTSTITERKVSAVRFEDYAVVVLANVRSLNDDVVTRLREFVQAGGAVVVAPGDRVNVDWYREQLSAGDKPLLPGTFLKATKDDASIHVVDAEYRHRGLAIFDEPGNGRLSDATIRQWFPIDASEASALAMLSSGDPFACEGVLGEGRVLQLAIPVDQDGSDLPLRPFFVPLMQELMRALSERGETSRNLSAGDVAILPVVDEASKTVTVESPTGERRSVEIIDDASVRTIQFAGTYFPGAYSMADGRGNKTSFVVRARRDESRLELLDDAGRQLLADRMGAVSVGSFAELEEQSNTRKNGRPIWRTVLVALLALMLLEVYLQQRFARSPQ